MLLTDCLINKVFFFLFNDKALIKIFSLSNSCVQTYLVILGTLMQGNDDICLNNLKTLSQ